MDWKILGAIISLIGGTYLAIIILQRYFSAHMADRRKHPCADDVVFKDVCDQVQITNSKEHNFLNDCLERVEEQTGKRFAELKTDMKDGFKELTELIKEIRKER